ncbi:PHD-zinc-finger like domain-containing protein [Scheffersomyces coipomensis]|uniref:PHD-zinc-finger like domain-containing protein n=1 Tax=Scheffersomyces coipomensis TaxID=1788519 RepID=UPI00315D6FEE
MNNDAYTASRSIANPDYSEVMIFDSHSKPREERDYKEIYPDLDEQNQLKVFILDNETTDNHANNIRSGNQGYIVDLKKPVFKKLDSEATNTSHQKYSKALTEYGYQEPNKANSIKDLSFIRPFQVNSNSTLTDVSETVEALVEKRKKLVEYDMDEQDYLYLKERNENPKNIIKIIPEVFEIMMTTLELEWDKLDHQMNSIVSNMNDSEVDDPNKLLSLDYSNIEKYGTDDGIIPGSIYDQKCAVCDDSDCDNSNAIVFCDGCDIAVHQECYGIAFIPECQWLCRKCMINKNRNTDCVFCPSKTGAFKQLDNSLWSHVICALWINELYFANPIYMEPIEGMDLIPKSRWKLTCYICRQRVGACIQCVNRNCFQAYHVTCARRAGLYMELTKGVQGAINNKNTLKTFCDKHGPGDYDSSTILQGIQRTRMFYRDTKILNEENVKLNNNKKIANKLNIFKWQTESNTPIAPKVFSDVLFDILRSLKVENQVFLPDQSNNQVKTLNRLPNRTKYETWDELREICNEICRYWCLKREQKNGAPLIRKNNNLISTSSILYNNIDNSLVNDEYELAGVNSLEELKERIDFATILVNDLEKVFQLGNYTLQRQLLIKDINEVDFKMIDSIYFPIKKVIEYFLDTINGKFDESKVLQNYKLKGGILDDNSTESITFQNTSALKHMHGSYDFQTKMLNSEPGVNAEPRGTTSPPIPEKFGMNNIIQKNLSYGYSSVGEFQVDIEKLNVVITLNNKPGSLIVKVMKKWMKEFYRVLPELIICEIKVLERGAGSKLENQNKNTVIDFENLPFLDVIGSKAYSLANDDVDMDLDDLTDVEDEFAKDEQYQIQLEKFLYDVLAN